MTTANLIEKPFSLRPQHPHPTSTKVLDACEAEEGQRVTSMDGGRPQPIEIIHWPKSKVAQWALKLAKSSPNVDPLALRVPFQDTCVSISTFSTRRSSSKAFCKEWRSSIHPSRSQATSVRPHLLNRDHSKVNTNKYTTPAQRLLEEAFRPSYTLIWKDLTKTRD